MNSDFQSLLSKYNIWGPRKTERILEEEKKIWLFNGSEDSYGKM